MKIFLHSFNKLQFALVLIFITTWSASAVTYYSRVSGSFATVGTWSTSPIGTPTNATTLAITDIFIIQSGHNITLGAARTVAGISVSSGGILTLGTQQLTIAGPVSNAGTITASSGRIMQMNGVGDFTNTGTITFTGNGRIYFSGNMTNSGTMTLLGSQVRFYGTDAGNYNVAGFTTTGPVDTRRTAGSVTFTGNVSCAGIAFGGTSTTINLGAGLTHTSTGIVVIPAGNTLNGGSSTLNINRTGSGFTKATTGTFIPGTGTINYNFAGIQTVGVFTYNNLTLSGSGVKTFAATTVNGNLTLSGTASATTGAALTIGGSVILDSGTVFNAAALTHNVGGNWINNGATFTAGTSTINLNGVSQSIGGTSASAFNNLTISGSGLKSATNDITVNGILNLAKANYSATQGCLEMTKSHTNYPGTTITHYLDSYILTMGATATTTGIGDVTGTVKRNTIIANTSYTFGHQFTTLALSPGTMPSAIAVSITIGATGPGPSGTDIIRDAVQRTYEIVPTGGSGSFVTANFHYLDSELTSDITAHVNSESKLTTMDYDIDSNGHGAPFSDEHGRSNFDHINNFVGLSGVPISYFIQVPATHEWRTIFTLRDYSEGYAKWTGLVSNSWTNGSNWNPFGAVPTDLTHVIIPDAASTPNDPILSPNVTINTLSIENGGVLVMNSETLTIQNSFSGGWEDLNTSGNDPGTSTVIFTRPNTSISGYARFYNIEIATGADITNQAASTMKIGGSITKNGTGKWLAYLADTTIEYNGAAQTVLQTDASPSYHNLILSGSGFKTLPTSTLTLHGSLTLSGTATAAPSNPIQINQDLIIGSGSTFTAGALSHTVGGNFVNSGTFNSAESTIDFDGIGAQTIDSGGAAFNVVNITNVGGVCSAANNITATTLDNGGAGDVAAVLDMGGFALSAATDNTGAKLKFSGATNGLAVNTGTVEYYGGAQTVTAGTYNNLTIGIGGGTASSDITVNGVLSLSTNPSATKGSLDMGTSVLSMGGSATTISSVGEGDVTGIIKRTSFALNTAYSFGNQFTTIKFTAGTLPAEIQVKTAIGAAPSWKTEAIQRVYEIIRTGGDGTTLATLNLHYLDSELNGSTEANLVKYAWESSGGGVSELGRTAFSTTENWSGQSNFEAQIWHTAFGLRQLTLANASGSSTKIWLGSVSSDWSDPFNWSPNGEPTLAQDVIIPEASTTIYGPIVTGTKSINKLTIDAVGALTVESGNNLIVVNAIANAGTLTIENNANLIQTNNVANTGAGNTIVNRDSNNLSRLDYTMWSSPVLGQNLLAFSPATTLIRFYTYNPVTNVYNAIDPSVNNFATGTGYLIRMPNTAVTAPLTETFTGIFTGTPNNGDVTLAVNSGMYYAIGNPYPSTINADTFITDNGITEALYFWRKTNSAVSSSYATFTTAGGTANTGGGSNIVPNGTIQVGQGFIAKSTSATLKFTNAMRTVNNGNQILKTKQIEKNRIWLNLSNDTAPVNQMMVAYMTGATQDIDAAIDGRYFNDSQTALNSLINNEEFAIQGRALPFDGADVVPLAFKTTTAGNFTIAIDHFDGLFLGSQDIFLKDNATGIETDLKAGAYTFTAVAGVDNARFSLKYQKNLGVNSPIFDENSVLVYKNKGAISIKSSTTIANVKVYDVQGRLVFEKAKVNAKETTFESTKLAHQVLIVKVTSEDNKIINKKIVY